MRRISKSVFLSFIKCPTLGWLARREQAGPLSVADQFRMEEGIEVGKMARLLFPKGILVEGVTGTAAAQRTAGLMRDTKVGCLFEGTAVVGDAVARADVLRRKGSRWHLYEVKASLNDRDEFVDDMAYTTMVMRKAGCDISGVSLLLLSRDYRLGMGIKSLFVEVDHTRDVFDRAVELAATWEQASKVTARAKRPPGKLMWECRSCELFAGCVGKGIRNPIFDLHGLRIQKFAKLQASGVIRIEDIPAGFDLNVVQARIRDCVQTRKLFVAGQLRKALDRLKWPVYYLDFETVGTALPLYPDIAPHQQIPTQYSIHKRDRMGLMPQHSEYLADPAGDCRRELAARLVRDLGSKGSVLTYTDFEKRTMHELGLCCPELHKPLNAVIARSVDLKRIIQESVYHPSFHGSFSIKDVLPALLKDRSYENLEIHDGSSAISAFANLARGKYEPAQAEALKRGLLDYCRQDTLSMVRLHEKLAEYA